MRPWYIKGTGGRATRPAWYVDETTGCWNWNATTTRGGYGTYGGKVAHRITYENVHGPVPDGLQIDHLCRNPACVNPDHLEAVSAAENLRRRVFDPASRDEYEVAPAWPPFRAFTFPADNDLIAPESDPNFEPAPRASRQPTPFPAGTRAVSGSSSVAADPGDTPRSDLRRTRCEARVPLASPACSSSSEDVVEASGTHLHL